MNRKGQALVEFIIILPVIIFILMMLIDFMLLFSYKNKLESNMNEVITLYKSNNFSEIEEAYSSDFDYIVGEKYTTLTLKNSYKFITPGLNLILGNPYEITCERVILNEQ